MNLVFLLYLLYFHEWNKKHLNLLHYHLTEENVPYSNHSHFHLAYAFLLKEDIPHHYLLGYFHCAHFDH